MQNISACIITKNEKKKLEKCIRALLPWGFEIVVADTGSTDGTKEMAKRFGAKVCAYAWCDDFAAAKNYVISQASYDMVLVIDSDEYIEPYSTAGAEALQKQLADNRRNVGRIRRKNVFVRNGERCVNQEWINRLFDRRYFHYEGRIHEQVVRTASSGCREYETYLTNLVIAHDGYDGDENARKEKSRRNIRLLLKEFEINPSDTYILYQLGKSYYMAGDYPNAVRYFELALGYDLNPRLEYVIDMVETYGYALLNCNRAETALQLEGVYEAFGDCADFKFLMGLIYMNNERFDEAVAEFEKAAAYKTSRAEGVNSYLAYYNAGVIRECLGDTLQAVRYYKKSGEYGKAKERLQRIEGQAH